MQVVLELWTVGSNGLPATKLRDLASGPPNVTFSADFSSAPVLDWNTTYAVVMRPTSFSAGAWFRVTYGDAGSAPLSPGNFGRSLNAGSSWTIFSNQASGSVAIQFRYELGPWRFFLNRPNEAANYYISFTQSGPSGITYLGDLVNGSPYTNPTSISGEFEYTVLASTTSAISNSSITATLQCELRYEKNPMTIDMFNVAEAYLSRIDFLDGGSIQLNDSPDQVFSGNAGTSLTFNPMVLVWEARVLSGRVRLTMMVFE
ncbi:MAG: hypothetical protein ABDH63_00720 [Candidatus Caldarchaeales archaeon]